MKEMVHRIFKSIVPYTNKRDLELALLQQINTLQTLRYLADGGIDDRINNMIAQSMFKELIGVLRLRILLSGWCIDDSSFSIHTLREYSKDNLIDVENFSHSNCSEIKLGLKWNKHEIEDAGFISADLRTNGLLESVMEAYSSYFSLEQAILRTNISYYQNVSYIITEPNGNYHYVKFSIGEIVEATLPEKQQSDFGIIKGIIKHTWNDDKNYMFIYLNCDLYLWLSGCLNIKKSLAIATDF
ncbi:hypothetical protein C2G38_2035933 [Gigaspora rosea]|uniref:Uncharacterized protein n=1 Tax=Gigaspora rosea TaxID=44941 RepID=A0A397VE59_9GLOM|nr:hypothetical protein C2G38_2035933 [Gigaspora rosea]